MSGNLRSIRGSLSAGGVAATLGLLLTIAAVTAMAEKGKQPAVEPNTTDANTADANDPNSIMKRFTVSKETTFIKGPRNKDGTINYVAWLRKRYSKGVTHKNNAAVLLAKAMGPEMLPEDHLALYRKELGVKLPKEGNYFQNTYEYAKAEKLDEEKLCEQLDKAMVAPWTAQERPHLAKWLKGNAKPLAVMVEGTRRSRYYMPIVADGNPPLVVNMQLPSLLRFRSAAEAMTAEAMRKLGNGDAAGASEDLLAVHRLGRLIGRGPTLIDRLVGLAVDSLAADGDRALLRDPDVKPAVLGKHLAALGKLPAIPSMAEAINTCERFMVLDTIMTLIRDGFFQNRQNLLGQNGKAAKGPRIGWWLIDFDIILRRFNDEYDILVKIAKADTHKEFDRLRVAHERRIVDLAQKYNAKYLSKQVAISMLSARAKCRERIGKLLSDYLVCILVPAIDRAMEIERGQKLSMDVVRVGLALRLYQEAHGKLPGKLSALTPKYLKKVPGDWFSGKELIYKRSKCGKGFIVFSVGANLTEDGGFGRHGLDIPAESMADDIAVWYRYGEQDDGE